MLYHHGKFNYLGTPNDDLAVLTSVLRRVDGVWKVVHGQRSAEEVPLNLLLFFLNIK